MHMQIVIPTYRRVHDQATFLGLPGELHKRVTFVVDERDSAGLWAKYRETGVTMLVHPPGIATIAQKRAWILGSMKHEKIVMLDDDLRFAARLTPESTKLAPATPLQVLEGFIRLEDALSLYAHAGFSARQGNNNLEAGWHENTRMMYVLGYRTEVVREHCQLGRIEHREDMDYTLQLLRAGFANSVYTDLCVDQRYNAAGGASASGRTVAASNADAHKLAELHPGVVKVVQKAYSGSVPRQEVIVQWKKAYQKPAS